MTLENGIQSHDTFSRVFKLLSPSGLQKTLLRLAQVEVVGRSNETPGCRS